MPVLLLAGLVAAESLWTGTPHLNVVLSCFTGVVVAEGHSLSSRLPGRSCPSTVRNKNFYPPHVALPVSSVDLGPFFSQSCAYVTSIPRRGVRKKVPKVVLCILYYSASRILHQNL